LTLKTNINACGFLGEGEVIVIAAAGIAKQFRGELAKIERGRGDPVTRFALVGLMSA
jgi:hypothetical protein